MFGEPAQLQPGAFVNLQLARGALGRRSLLRCSSATQVIE
jgi:hypothetical protein